MRLTKETPKGRSLPGARILSPIGEAEYHEEHNRKSSNPRHRNRCIAGSSSREGALTRGVTRNITQLGCTSERDSRDLQSRSEITLVHEHARARTPLGPPRFSHVELVPSRKESAIPLRCRCFSTLYRIRGKRSMCVYSPRGALSSHQRVYIRNINALCT